MSDHPSVDELADAAEGLLPAERAAVVDAHVARCEACRAHTAALLEVRELLAHEPLPPVPAGVAQRLAAVVTAEQARRTAPLRVVGGSGWADGTGGVRARPTLGTFGADLPRHRRRRWIAPALAAAVVALVVGFGGYVLSARAGLNEPPVVAAVNSAELGPDAKAVENGLDLSPHRFTRAWQCARAVTSGRITGIAATTVDGVPALLVYIRSDGRTQVTLVTGCGTEPSAGPSALVSR